MAQLRETVCIIDPAEFAGGDLCTALRASGYHVQTYSTARSFLTQGIPHGPTCVILEIELPDLNGLQLQAFLRQNGRSEQLIFLSKDGNIRACVDAMKGGAIDFLVKPAPHDALLHAVTAALKKSETLAAKRACQHEARARVATLTRRQLDVLRLLVRGLSNREIATDLGAAEATIKIHRKRIMEKMGSHSLPELVLFAQTAGIKAPFSLASAPSAASAPIKNMIGHHLMPNLKAAS